MNPTYKRILLDNGNTPIIVSSEEIKENDYYIDDSNQLRQSFTDDENYWAAESRDTYLKIISGLPNQKPIGWNGFEKELGYIDVEKLILGCFGRTEYDNIHQNAKLSLIHLYKQLSDKDFSKEEMIEFANYVVKMELKGSQVTTDKLLNIWQKHEQPKQFQIEVEETENSFKIVKVL